MEVSNKESFLTKLKYGIKDYGWCYLFIAVPVLLFCIFTVYPIISAFVMSFEEYNVLQSQWVGLQNYQQVFRSSIFWKAMKNTLIYVLGTVPINILIAFILSVIIFPLKEKTQTFFKAAFYLPAVTSGVVMSMVWLYMFDPQPTGFFNAVMRLFGLPTQVWLASSNTALFSLMLMTYLGGHGGAIILYLASLGNIPKSLYEAADIDHASWWSKVKNITWPMLKPTTLYLLITGIIGSFQVFMPSYLMTKGGPDFATTTIGYLIFQDAFTEFDFGLASAESFVLAAIIVIISVIQFKYLSSDVEY